MTMKKLFPIVATLLVLAISGCAPQVDTAAEEAAIREANDAWFRAYEANDPDGMAVVFTDDASLLPPNAPIATGREAVRAVWAEMIETPGFLISGEITKIELSRAGDLAYIVGTNEITVNDAEGNPVTTPGKWVAVWKKQPDGTWKSVLDIWNDNQPAGE
jgi:uncharacterized protein (TIGR02246 family)